MTQAGDFEQLPLSAVLRINSRCDDFEAACRSGGRPTIDPFLEGTAGPERVVLVRHLAAIDFDYHGLSTTELLQRLKAEAIPTLDDWTSRPAAEIAQELIASGTLTDFQAESLLGPQPLPLLLDDYLILDRIGSGGMGTVYRAVHQRMKREVALKVLSGGVEEGSSRRDWFQREIETAGKLHHPNIVTAFDAGEARGVSYLVTEYVPGQDLQRYIAERGPLPEAEVIDMIRDAALGLSHAHQAGVIHRDVKPSNLIRTPAGLVRVLDVGLARLAHHDTIDDAAIVGTPGFMAPEQASDPGSVDARVDVYGLGAALFFLLTGSPPFAGGSAEERLKAQASTKPPRVRMQRPDVSAKLESLVQRMMAARPSERVGSMAEVVDALDRLRTRRTRRLLAFAGLGLCVAVGLALIAWPAPAPSPHPVTTPVMQTLPFDAAAYQAEWARDLSLPLQIEPLPGLNARLIPPGRFLMGTPGDLMEQWYAAEPEAERKVRIAAEAPREVTVESPFYMGVTEVTVGQFRAFVEASQPAYLTLAERSDGAAYRLDSDRRWSMVAGATWRDAGEQPVSADYPACNLSRDDCADYCRWLSRRLEGRYECRLPTEAEWEYACRAGSDAAWSSGPDARELAPIAWFADTVSADDARFRPAGHKAANGFGLFDLHGNLEEWCTATPPATGAVLRGGNVRSPAFALRCGGREIVPPATSRGGFRVVLIPR